MLIKQLIAKTQQFLVPIHNSTFDLSFHPWKAFL